MKKAEMLAKLRAFPYDPAEYWVITGGAMVLHGFREETHDVDLGCTKKLADELESAGCLYKVLDDGQRWFRLDEELEVFENWLFDTVVPVDGVPVISVQGLLQMKQTLGREKDLRDIRLIQKKLEGKRTLTSFRPQYHASVPSGWSNDPNGTVFYRGKAHLFFQHYPHKAEWGTMHWGHFTTEDFVHWTVLPVALVPDQPYEVLCGCCSGSAIEKDGKLYLLYTAAQPELQRQCLAVSGDGGIRFAKHEDNPILTAQMLDDEVSELDFRDPRLFEKNGWYYFIAGARVLNEKELAELGSAGARKNGSPASQTASVPVNPSSWYPDMPLRSPSAGDVSGSESQRAGVGNLILCKSRDLLRWEYVGHLFHRQPEYDDAFFTLNGVYECPDYLLLDGKELLLTSPQNLPQKGNHYQNVHSALYMLGKLDFETGRFRIDSIGELDCGFDFYAAQTLRMPDGRVILIAWKEMWDRNYPTQKEGWAGTYSFPRELRIEEDRLIQKPARELDAFCKNRVSREFTLDGGATISDPDLRGSVIRLRFILEPGNAKRAGVRVFAGKQHETVVSYDREAGTVEIDRSRSGLPFRGREEDVNLRKCEVGSLPSVELELLLDVSTLEVFIDGGKHVMTANVYPDPEDRNVLFFAEGGAAVFRKLEKYDIDPEVQTAL